MPYYPNTKINTIEYDSPSGKINVGKWVPPFRKIEDGFGFMGVVAEDVGTGKLQCHICGKWYEGMTTHVWATHKINTLQYKERFGLFRGTPLRSRRIRKIQSETMHKMRKKDAKHRHKFPKGEPNKAAGNRKGQKKPLENQNRFGVCDLQVVDKIRILADKLGKTPTLLEIIAEYGAGFSFAIHKRHGGYIALLKKMGLEPVTSSHNPKYSQEYFVKKGVEAALNNNPLVGSQIFNQSEARNIYQYFTSQKEWKREVIRELVRNENY